MKKAASVQEVTAGRRDTSGTLNVLIAGHRSEEKSEAGRLPADAGVLKLLRDALNKIVLELRDFAHDKGRRLVILTGDSTGTDEWARTLAVELEVDSIEFGVSKAGSYQCGSTEPAGDTKHRRFFLFESGPHDDRSVQAVDEAKVFHADIVVVVWDGMPPRGHGGGTVRLLMEALRQRRHVFWIDARQERTGQVFWLNGLEVGRSELALLDADERIFTFEARQQPSEMKDSEAIFNAVKGKDFCWTKVTPATHELITKALADWIEPEGASRFESVVEFWDPGTRWRPAGWFHSPFLRLFGYPKFDAGRCKAWPGSSWPAVVVDDPAERSLREGFDRLDRAALHASRCHRDRVLAVHVAAALAVLCAVIGSALTEIRWGLIELFVLLLILAVVVYDRRRPIGVHAAYLALRQGAEILRVLVLLRPFLAGLPRIERALWADASEKPSDSGSASGANVAAPQRWWAMRWLSTARLDTSKQKAFDRANELPKFKLVAPQIWWAIRWLRAAPLEASVKEVSVDASALADLRNRLGEVIKEQRDYHVDTSEKWEKLHRNFERAVGVVFCIALLSVVAHLFAGAVSVAEQGALTMPHWVSVAAHWLHEQSSWLLVGTAAGPAIAASLHAVAGKLEFERLARRSRDTSVRLLALGEAVKALDSAATRDDLVVDPADAFFALRALAIETAQTLYSEHESWVELLETQNVGITV